MAVVLRDMLDIYYMLDTYYMGENRLISLIKYLAHEIQIRVCVFSFKHKFHLDSAALHEKMPQKEIQNINILSAHLEINKK